MKRNTTNNSKKRGLIILCALLASAMLFSACSKNESKKSVNDNAFVTDYSKDESVKDDTDNSSVTETPNGGAAESATDDKKPQESEAEPMPDSSVVSEPDKLPGLEAESRPEENLEIPYNKTKLFHVFDKVDKYHLYIRTKQHTLSPYGYTTHIIEYAFNGVKIYMHQAVDGDDLYYYSDGKQLYGLDFEEETYTLLSPDTYTADEILYLGNYQHCSSTGVDLFLGKELEYEDYSESDTEWIRYYFDENDVLAGYERYNTLTGEIVEITSYEAFTSEFPEDAVLFFDIPAGFDKYTDVVEYSQLFGEEY